MTTADEWDEIAVQIRAEGDPWRSRHLVRLYAIADEDGLLFLGSFRRQIDEDRMRDLVHDLLVARLEQIIAAVTPRAFFCRALQNRAKSWLRRADARVCEKPSAWNESNDTGQEARSAFRVDALAAMQQLAERDREIAIAAACGEDRASLASQFGTSRANVDQIVSRVNRRFRRGAP